MTDSADSLALQNEQHVPANSSYIGLMQVHAAVFFNLSLHSYQCQSAMARSVWVYKK